MAQVYKFRVQLKELEKYIWRDIEISSLSSVAKLGYAILAAFEANASHLFCIEYSGINYEFDFYNMDYSNKQAVNPTTVKLQSLKFKVGDSLTMRYDYGAGWEFDIKVVSITEMKKGSGTHYPYITDGAGKGIIEDTSPGILFEYIRQTDETGELPTYIDRYFEHETEWDYRRFDLKASNILFKFEVGEIEDAYENID